MGWAGGSRLFSEVIKAAKVAIPSEESRKEFYKPVIEAFEDADWDTQDECLDEDPAYKAVVKEMHPGWFED